MKRLIASFLKRKTRSTIRQMPDGFRDELNFESGGAAHKPHGSGAVLTDAQMARLGLEKSAG